MIRQNSPKIMDKNAESHQKCFDCFLLLEFGLYTKTIGTKMREKSIYSTKKKKNNSQTCSKQNKIYNWMRFLENNEKHVEKH